MIWHWFRQTKPRRFPLWPSAKQLLRMARHPSAYAPDVTAVIGTQRTALHLPEPLPWKAQFLQNIRKEPENEQLYLDFAEELSAHSDPQGEWIRSQIQSSIETQADSLWQKYHEQWEAPFRLIGARDFHYKRGVIVGMSLTGRAWCSFHDWILRQTPLLDLRLIAIRPILEEVLSVPGNSELRSLDLHGNRLGKQLQLAMQSWETPGRLQQLHLGYNKLLESEIRELLQLPFFNHAIAVVFFREEISASFATEFPIKLVELRLI